MKRRLLSLAAAIVVASTLGCSGGEGAAGMQGPPGADGSPGSGAEIPGPQGPGGPTGDVGPPGPAGDSGADGSDGRDLRAGNIGLELEIIDAEIASDGTATARFALRDALGAPLDRQGWLTPGAVGASFILAWLDERGAGDPGVYTSYTTRIQTSGDVSAVQASTDTGGSFAVVDEKQGIYEYTFGKNINVADASKTHTIGAIATRTVNGVRYVANTTFSWVPAGGQPLHREVVTTNTCNDCHGRLEFHGGARRDVSVCVMCHNPQTVDPDTGRNLDFGEMVHKIHSGKHLPSVVAGTPYQIIGFGNSVHDYSTVAYPQPVQHCESCHSDGEHSDNWKTKPTRHACGSCHDTTSFTTAVGEPLPDGMTEHHTGGKMEHDNTCTVCHQASGGLQGRGIAQYHQTPLNNPAAPKVELKIINISSTAPGEYPQIDFAVEVNGVRRNLATNPLASMAVAHAGPTTDYSGPAHRVTITSGPFVPLGDGVFRYTYTTPMPLQASGTYAFTLEGRYQDGPIRVDAFNPIAYAAVTDPEPVPRRDVISADQCNTCHYNLGFHGGTRRNPEYCNFCHNGTLANTGRVERYKDSVVEAQSVHFKPMIHKIHMGSRMAHGYVLGGNPPPNRTNVGPGGTPKDFGEVRYPRDPRDCVACHVETTERLPLPASVLPSRSVILTCTDHPDDPGYVDDDYCDNRSSQDLYMPPESSACVSCHDATWSVVHAELNRTQSGAEACTTCHGPGAAFDATVAHRRAP